jgi:regulator of RNase E activity RraA
MFIDANTDSIKVAPSRPRLPSAAVKPFQGASSALVGDALGRLGLMDPAIGPIWSGSQCSGPAVTVLTREGDNLAIHRAIDDAEPGDILVVNALGGTTRAVFGDLLAEICLAAGIAGAWWSPTATVSQ